MRIEKLIDRTGTILINSSKLHIRKVNTQLKAPLGDIKGIVLHHSACPRNVVFDDYHINIAEVEKEPIICQLLGYNQKGQHLWGRNTGMIGISISCMDNPDDLPSPNQINYLSTLIAEVCCWKNLNPSATIKLAKKKIVNKELVDVYNSKGQLETIEAPVISDHAFFAKKDGYYPDRWDIGNYYSIVVKQAKSVYKELKAGKRQFIFKEIL